MSAEDNIEEYLDGLRARAREWSDRMSELRTYRRFVLQRDTDVTGVSGTGVVAEGVEFSNGVVALHWTSEFPTSVVFHHRGMESVEHVHGHSGATKIVWLD